MATKIVVPSLGESILEATIARWIKKPGDPVTVGEPVVELETEKVNLEVGAERSGVLARVSHPEGTDVRVGDILGEIEEGQPAQPEASPEKPPETQSAANPAAAKTPAPEGADKEAVAEQPSAPPSAAAQPDQQAESATPLARRMAQDLKIPIETLRGSGPGGRVVRQDVERYLSTAGQPEPASPAATDQQPSTPSTQPTGQRPEERVRLSRRRRTIAQRLVEAQHNAAMLTTFNDFDMSAIMQIRQRRKEAFKARHGVGLGILSFFVKASVQALIDFPRLNAEIQNDEMLLKKYYDIGIAVAAEEGLVVPVLRDANQMTFSQIEVAIQGFAEKARANTFTLEDLTGGTFSITNGGVFGSLLSTPILNAPQVAILGMHRIEDRPVAVGGQVVIRPMMYGALSYDHRIVDGKEAVQFLARIKELVENPELLLIDT